LLVALAVAVLVVSRKDPFFFALAVAVASEIGPGFSPDIKRPPLNGL
jgi:hypothetical protein